jgi:hypothetical protein
MGLISDVAVLCWLLLGHWCQAMSIFGQHFAERLALSSKSDPKLITQAIMTLYQLPPDHWICSRWV